ncbi:MAG: hypothetical protein IH845_04195 [Nanoarchaeota archaeon]|nr:hypothetical protein [Nanoarchaeota archaeon]
MKMSRSTSIKSKGDYLSNLKRNLCISFSLVGIGIGLLSSGNAFSRQRNVYHDGIVDNSLYFYNEEIIDSESGHFSNRLVIHEGYETITLTDYINKHSILGDEYEGDKIERATIKKPNYDVFVITNNISLEGYNRRYRDIRRIIKSQLGEDGKRSKLKYGPFYHVDN